ncbi:conserved membrane hypothetical protein [Desulfamplus magnetovallimortis]|uniref:EamA domain-containing protein n=1 Tax=Desulfamplus magnetovallimortis TaxID=1246637 RepID=A0A1W1HHU7_9BACT|nr:DMT family transporter [Desulfamplus magnetovallimortis]SLM31948.1 conserved membrane hypothetical protein [Desulfamplus magnetovallimortis]
MEIKNRALSGLLAGAVLISFSSVWVKICGVSATTSAFYRVFFGGIILLLIVLKKRELKWHGGRIFCLGMLCSLFFSLDLVMYHKCIHHVGPGLGTILANFQVFVLTLFSFMFLKEKISLLFILSLPMAFTGLFMVVGIHPSKLDSSYQAGILMGLAASFFYSGFLLSLRKLQGILQRFSLYYVLMLVSLITALFLAMEVVRIDDSFAIPTLKSLLSLGALAIFSQVAGFVLITNALPHVSPSISGIILLTQPALAFVWDVLLFSRPTDALSWFGVAITLIAIYIATSGQNKKS